jgi:hypothetical protein
MRSSNKQTIAFEDTLKRQNVKKERWIDAPDEEQSGMASIEGRLLVPPELCSKANLRSAEQDGLAAAVGWTRPVSLEVASSVFACSQEPGAIDWNSSPGAKLPGIQGNRHSCLDVTLQRCSLSRPAVQISSRPARRLKPLPRACQWDTPPNAAIGGASPFPFFSVESMANEPRRKHCIHPLISSLYISHIVYLIQLHDARKEG